MEGNFKEKCCTYSVAYIVQRNWFQSKHSLFVPFFYRDNLRARFCQCSNFLVKAWSRKWWKKLMTVRRLWFVRETFDEQFINDTAIIKYITHTRIYWLVWHWSSEFSTLSQCLSTLEWFSIPVCGNLPFPPCVTWRLLSKLW